MDRKDGIVVRDIKLLTDGLRNFADLLKSINNNEDVIIPEIMDQNEEDEIICEEVTKTSRIILKRKK